MQTVQVSSKRATVQVTARDRYCLCSDTCSDTRIALLKGQNAHLFISL